VRVVIDCGRRGEEDDRRAAAELLRAAYELAADALPLVCRVDGEVRQISAVDEVADAARDADEAVAVPRADDEVRALEHRLHARAILDGAALAERGGAVDRDDCVEIQLISCPVDDHVSVSAKRSTNSVTR